MDDHPAVVDDILVSDRPINEKSREGKAEESAYLERMDEHAPHMPTSTIIP